MTLLPNSCHRRRLPRHLAGAITGGVLVVLLAGCAESRSQHWAQTAPLISAGGAEIAVFDDAPTVSVDPARSTDEPTAEH